MPLSLSVALCGIIIVATTVVIRFGWPILQWRTYNKVHGDLRIIEIGVMMSRVGCAGFGSRPVPTIFGSLERFVQNLATALRGRPARSAGAAATLQNASYEADRGASRNAAEGTVVGGRADLDGQSGRHSLRRAECVIYVTLKVGNH